MSQSLEFLFLLENEEINRLYDWCDCNNVKIQVESRKNISVFTESLQDIASHDVNVYNFSFPSLEKHSILVDSNNLLHHEQVNALSVSSFIPEMNMIVVHFPVTKGSFQIEYLLDPVPFCVAKLSFPLEKDETTKSSELVDSFLTEQEFPEWFQLKWRLRNCHGNMIPGIPCWMYVAMITGQTNVYSYSMDYCMLAEILSDYIQQQTKIHTGVEELPSKEAFVSEVCIQLWLAMSVFPSVDFSSNSLSSEDVCLYFQQIEEASSIFKINPALLVE